MVSIKIYVQFIIFQRPKTTLHFLLNHGHVDFALNQIKCKRTIGYHHKAQTIILELM
jgi:hypothetical protein